MESRDHWEHVYASKAPNEVSWYAPHLLRSLQYVKATSLDPSAAVIDVGGGESTLVDDLLYAGYSDVTVLDISAKALDVTKARLAERAAGVQWVAADVLEAALPAGRFDIWHDRAVFHFLVDQTQRDRYIAQVLTALRPGGFAIVGTFGQDGPEQCSGLPVSRYDAATLHGTFGAPFQLISSAEEQHLTPWGSAQQFVYCFCRRQHDT